MANYKEIKMYEVIKDEVRNVIEAEENSAAWRAEARSRMRDVNALILAAKKINKDTEIDAKELVAQIRAELTPAEADPEAEEATEDETPNAGASDNA